MCRGSPLLAVLDPGGEAMNAAGAPKWMDPAAYAAEKTGVGWLDPARELDYTVWQTGDVPESRMPTLESPDSPAALYTRPAIGAIPTIDGLSAGMTPIQQRSLISGANGTPYTSPEAQNYWKQLVGQSLITGPNTLNTQQVLLPSEEAYMRDALGVNINPELGGLKRNQAIYSALYG